MEIAYPLNLETINGCFQPATDKDSVKVQLLGYANFLDILQNNFQSQATKQTRNISAYIGERSNKDYFTLWYFVRTYIPYQADEKDNFETIKLPNHLWEHRTKKGGDCEDKMLMVSGILSNWNIQHDMVIEHLSDTIAHIFVQTADGIIIDPCNSKFNQQVRIKEQLPIAEYRKNVILSTI